MLETITKYQTQLYDGIIYITYALYFLIFFGLSSSAPKYLNTLNFYVHIFISFFLLYRFNPFRSIQFNELDRKVAFSAGVFIMTTSTINELVLNNLHYVHKIFNFQAR